MAKVKIKIIEDDTLVSIQVSGLFYKQVKQCMFNMLDSFEKPDEVISKIVDKKELNREEYTLVTLMSIIKEVEDSATKQNLVVDSEVDVPDEEEGEVTSPS